MTIERRYFGHVRAEIEFRHNRNLLHGTESWAVETRWWGIRPEYGCRIRRYKSRWKALLRFARILIAWRLPECGKRIRNPRERQAA